jgi:hypothetical protein
MNVDSVLGVHPSAAHSMIWFPMLDVFAMWYKSRSLSPRSAGESQEKKYLDSRRREMSQSPFLGGAGNVSGIQH